MGPPNTNTHSFPLSKITVGGAGTPVIKGDWWRTAEQSSSLSRAPAPQEQGWFVCAVSGDAFLADRLPTGL